MNTMIKETTLTLTEKNRRAAEKALPEFKDFGIHYLADRSAILEWARLNWSHDYKADELPRTLQWAVGIDACAHVRLANGGYFAGCESGQPGLFSLSGKGSFLEWRKDTKRPTRLFGQSVQTPAHFLNFITRNNHDPEAPIFLDLFQPYSEEYYDNWTLEQANEMEYKP